MWWVLIWIVLALGALAFLGLLGWRLIKQVIELGRELGRSGEKVATALEPVHEAYRPEPPVLLDPAGTTAPGLVGPGAARHGA
ncbi:hypothetical protein [Angustibacter aerolatus]